MNRLGEARRLLALRSRALDAATRRLADARAAERRAGDQLAMAERARAAAQAALGRARLALCDQPSEAPIRLLLVAASADRLAEAETHVARARNHLDSARTEAEAVSDALVRLRARHDALAERVGRMHRAAARAAETRQAAETDEQSGRRAA